MSEYTFECTHVGVAVGKLKITVEAKDLMSAITEMNKLIEVAEYTLLEQKKINMVLGIKLTNDMKIKHRKGKEIPLTRAERSYRTGFINALKK